MAKVFVEVWHSAEGKETATKYSRDEMLEDFGSMLMTQVELGRLLWLLSEGQPGNYVQLPWCIVFRGADQNVS
jgi:hypothetical protein